MPIFQQQCVVPGSCPISQGHLCEPRESGKSKDLPVPKNTKEMQSFFGLASYYRQFIPHFAKKAQRLHKLAGPTANKPKRKRMKLLKQNPK